MAHLSTNAVRVIALQALILFQQKTILERRKGFALGGAISILIANYDGSLSTNFRAVKAECSRLRQHPSVKPGLLLEAAREHLQIDSVNNSSGWPITPALAQLLKATTPPTQRPRRKSLKQRQPALI